jgi:hypothetical protein
MTAYARTPSGERAHEIVDGKPLCGIPGPLTPVHEVEFRDHCFNCDKERRRRGRAKRPRGPRKPGPKTEYLNRWVDQADAKGVSAK